MRYSVCISVLLLAWSTTVYAQKQKPKVPAPKAAPVRTDTTIKGTTLEVYQVYQPELKPMVKPGPVASLPPLEKDPVPQEYVVPQQTLYYSYKSLPLRPLALGKDTAALPPQNYALLAGGNLSTILAEIGVASLNGEKWSTTLNGRYLTQEGNLEGQVFRALTLGGSGNYRAENHIYEADIKFDRRVFGRFGYDHDAYNYQFEDIRMPYSTGTIGIGMQNTNVGPWQLDYHPRLNVNLFDSRQGHETSLDILLPGNRQIDSNLSVGLAFNGSLAWQTVGNIAASNHVVQLAPSISYRWQGFTGHFGLYPTLGEGHGLQLLPDISLSYNLADLRLGLAAGWQRQRIQNTLRQFAGTNPFILSTPLSVTQTLRDDVFAQATLGLGKHLTVSGKAAWQHYDPLPLFVNTGTDGKDFTVIYDWNVQAFVWGGSIRYTVGNDFSAGGEATWYNFYKHSYDQVWGEPAVRLKGDIRWQLLDGLTVCVYAEVLDKIWGRNTMGQSVSSRGVFDLGSSGEYTIGQRFTLFLRAENILNRRNERWLNYPSFGFNLYGGLRFRF